MINKKDPHLIAVERKGTSGSNHLWDGPLNTDGYPKGKGSSSGKNGMEVSKMDCHYKSGPITMRAKA